MIPHFMIKYEYHLKANAAGFPVSHVFGFGLLDAYDLVKAARNWKEVPTKNYYVKHGDFLDNRKPTSPKNNCQNRGTYEIGLTALCSY